MNMLSTTFLFPAKHTHTTQAMARETARKAGTDAVAKFEAGQK